MISCWCYCLLIHLLADEVKEIEKNKECGLRFDVPPDAPIFKYQPQDKLVCYVIKQISQRTTWTPKGF